MPANIPNYKTSSILRFREWSRYALTQAPNPLISICDAGTLNNQSSNSYMLRKDILETYLSWLQNFLMTRHMGIDAARSNHPPSKSYQTLDIDVFMTKHDRPVMDRFVAAMKELDSNQVPEVGDLHIRFIHQLKEHLDLTS